jgi:hypothetical protein
MHRFPIWVLFFVDVHFSALGVRAARLEAVWIGPDGVGGEGDWHTPSNWNLGVVPDNGVDGNGDGVPDIFDVRIDKLPTVTSLVRAISPSIEAAGLTIDEGDALNIDYPLGLVLRDADEVAEVLNNGTIGIGGWNGLAPMLAFAGEEVRLSGSGVMKIGIDRGRPGIFAALDGGRIVNGPDHTLLTSGVLHGGRIRGYRPDSLNSDVALTNYGRIVSEDRGGLSIHLNNVDNVNEGLIHANGGHLSLVADDKGRFRNRNVVQATDGFSQISIRGLDLTNEAGAVIRATNGGGVSFLPSSSGAVVRNGGLIEAADSGYIRIEGGNIVNEASGVIQARSGGGIWLSKGIFYPDPRIRILDSESTLSLTSGVTFENEGNHLTAGPGTLSLNGALIRGGELSNGSGSLVLLPGTGTYPILENVHLSGVASGNGFEIRGTVSVDSTFTAIERMHIGTSGEDGVLGGRGISQFVGADIRAGDFAVEIAPEHVAEFGDLAVHGGELRNNGTITSSAGVNVFVGTLSGYGVIDAPHIHIVDATLSPGDGIGTLRLLGDLGFSGTEGSLRAELADSSSDLVQIVGSFDLNAPMTTLALSGGLVGESYVIAQYTGERTGEFDVVTPGYNVIYDDLAKQIRVEPIPEPASIALGMMGIVVAVVYWRSHTAQRKRIS